MGFYNHSLIGWLGVRIYYIFYIILNTIMAGMAPNVPGSGNKIPVSSYIAGITELYPNVNRQRVIESSINSRERVDFMPINAGINQVLSDRYIEFRINGVMGSFLDLSTIALELHLTVTRGGNQLTATQNLGLANGLSNTLFKSVSVFLNEKMVESCLLYNYLAYMKMLASVKAESLNSVAKCGYFYDDYCSPHGITKVYTDTTFKEGERWEVTQMAEVKAYGVHTCFPLLLDLTTIDMYLLDSVDLRIRLELANNSWVMNTDITI